MELGRGLQNAKDIKNKGEKTGTQTVCGMFASNVNLLVSLCGFNFYVFYTWTANSGQKCVVTNTKRFE